MNRTELSSLYDKHLHAIMVREEAQGEPLLGMVAVAYVPLNRLAQRSYYGNDLHSIILKPYQFSCFNDDYIERVKPFDHESWLDNICYSIVEMVHSRRAPDFSQGATHYWRHDITTGFEDDLQYIRRLGDHTFWKYSHERRG